MRRALTMSATASPPSESWNIRYTVAAAITSSVTPAPQAYSLGGTPWRMISTKAEPRWLPSMTTSRAGAAAPYITAKV